MKQLRRLELVLVVMMLMLVHITLPAYADATNVVHVAPLAYVDATDAAENFANSLLQFFGY